MDKPKPFHVTDEGAFDGCLQELNGNSAGRLSGRPSDIELIYELYKGQKDLDASASSASALSMHRYDPMPPRKPIAVMACVQMNEDLRDIGPNFQSRSAKQRYSHLVKGHLTSWNAYFILTEEQAALDEPALRKLLSTPPSELQPDTWSIFCVCSDYEDRGCSF